MTNDPILGYERDSARVDPPLDHADYRSTRLRAPARPLLYAPQTLSELSGPALRDERVGDLDHDLTRQFPGEPLGERIIVHGKLLDCGGRPVPHTLVEIWQANAAGRYMHDRDRHPAPLDPNFAGVGRCVTDADGNYRFVTVKPGAYPWGNHENAWRPAHIHFSLFGTAFVQRLVTQMYFSGDPLLPLDPIYSSIPDPAGRETLLATFDIGETVPEWALAYRFNIVLRGPRSTPMENE